MCILIQLNQYTIEKKLDSLDSKIETLIHLEDDKCETKKQKNNYEK